MTMSRLHQTILACFTGVLTVTAQGASAPQIIASAYPQDDPIITRFVVTEAPCHADRTGAKDATGAIQKALDDCFASGGGVVFLPEGHYRMDGSLLLPEAVILRGEWQRPSDADATVRGTVLEVYAGKGDEKGRPFIAVTSGCGVRDLAIHYPEQSIEKPIPYPFTIGLAKAEEGHSSQRSCNTVMNVTLVNSFNGIRIGPNVSMHGYVRSVYGTPLNRGMQLDDAAGFPRFEDVHFSPRYWAGSGLAGSPGAAALAGFLHRENGAIGMAIYRSDNGHLVNVSIDQYATGILFGSSSGDSKRGGGSNGKAFGLAVSGARTGLRFETIKIQGWSISASRVEANAGDDPICVLMPGELKEGIVQFNQVCFGGNGSALRQSGKLNLASFVKCAFQSWGSSAGARPALDVAEGRLILGGCSFAARANKQNVHARLAKGVASAIVIGNTFAVGPDIVNDGSPNPNIIIDHSPMRLQGLPITEYAFAPRPKPARTEADSLYVVTSAPFGAAGDGAKDDTAAVQSALDAAGKAGGGTVYLPGGLYRVDGHLSVPAGVELRGIHDTPTYTFAARSVLLAYVKGDQGKEDGPPFITLNSDEAKGGSGVRGVAVFYPEQDYKSVKPYPWAIQSRGPRCWVVNTICSNAYKGVDFGTYKNDGHVVDWYAACSINTPLFVGNSDGPGWVENVQYNPQFWSSASSAANSRYKPLMRFPGDVPTVDELNKARAQYQSRGTGLTIGATADERVMGGFFNGVSLGVRTISQSAKETNAVILNQGTEGDHQYHIASAGDKGVCVINSSGHPGPAGGSHVVVEKSVGLTKPVRLFNVIHFGSPNIGYDINGGDTLVQQVYFTVAARERMFRVSQGSARIEATYLRGAMACDVLQTGEGKVSAVGNIAAGGLTIKGDVKASHNAMLEAEGNEPAAGPKAPAKKSK